MLIPQNIQDVANFFDKIPGIGPRAALRYAFWLASQPKQHTKNFAQTLNNLADNIFNCKICGAWSDEPICKICNSTHRDKNTLCVVANSQDIKVIEDSGVFRGKYHVLNGLIDPTKNQESQNIGQINKLIQRITANPEITELILALDPDILGDTTSLYITKKLSQSPVKISRLARGIPTGTQIEYADESTIADAYFNRKDTRL